MSGMSAALVRGGVTMAVARASAVVVIELDRCFGDERVGYFEAVGEHQSFVAEDLISGAIGDDAPVLDEAQVVAVFGFVHVVGGDENADALGDELVKQVPEGAS